MMPSGASRVAGVIGWPITHSLSPLIMRHWLDQAGVDGLYAPFAVEPGKLDESLHVFADTGMAGVNITLPHKEEARALCDELSESAQKIGAVNLLTFQDGKRIGDNTDATGFVQSLVENNVDISNHNALVLGAGGAARAIIHGLKSAGIASITLANRTQAKAEALADELAPGARILDWEAARRDPGEASLVINTTSLGLRREADLSLDWKRVAPGSIAVDIVYTPLMTGFLADAQSAGLQIIDGLGMLIGQARPSFEAFFGTAPPRDNDVRGRLIEKLGAAA